MMTRSISVIGYVPIENRMKPWVALSRKVRKGQSLKKKGSGALEVLRLRRNPSSDFQSLVELYFFCVGLPLASLTRTLCCFGAKIGVPLLGKRWTTVDRATDHQFY
ncbi:hypothetical protein U1Q18_031178 [Sarracenia purpurea var. burkii]